MVIFWGQHTKYRQIIHYYYSLKMDSSPAERNMQHWNAWDSGRSSWYLSIYTSVVQVNNLSSLKQPFVSINFFIWTQRERFTKLKLSELDGTITIMVPFDMTKKLTASALLAALIAYTALVWSSNESFHYCVAPASSTIQLDTFSKDSISTSKEVDNSFSDTILSLPWNDMQNWG